MLTLNLTLTAGQSVKYTDLGNFLRIMSAAAALTVRTFKNGQVLTESVGVGAGYAEEFSDVFNEVEIYSATEQTIQLVIRNGSKVYFDAPPTGNVNIQNLPAAQGAFTQSRATVTNANQQILAANANRRYLLIQNNDTAAYMRVTLNGVAATASTGFRIAAGGTLEVPNFAVTGAINVIMESAGSGANNVEFVEG